MANKSELTDGFTRYSALATEAKNAERDFDFRRSIEHATAAIPFLSATIGYLRRYEDVESPKLETVEIIFRYAPALFDEPALDAVAGWFEQASRADRTRYSAFPGWILAARAAMQQAQSAWPTSDGLGDTGREARELQQIWLRMGVVTLGPGPEPTYRLVTHPRNRARGKCGHCGRAAVAMWGELLDLRICSHCQVTSHFTIIARV